MKELSQILEALHGAFVDQLDLLNACRKYADEAEDLDTKRVRHIRADRVEDRLKITKEVLLDLKTQGKIERQISCAACEDNPKTPNIPCEVCGRTLMRWYP